MKVGFELNGAQFLARSCRFLQGLALCNFIPRLKREVGNTSKPPKFPKDPLLPRQRRHPRGHRQNHEIGDKCAYGPINFGGFHRARHVSRDHEGVASGIGG